MPDELTPLHPAYIRMMRLQWAILAVPLLVGALVLDVRGTLPPGVVFGPAAVLALIAVLRAPLRRYQARGYHVAEDRLRVVRGLLFRRDTVVPFGRVQHIDVGQGPLERLFGLGTLVLHTAGNHNASVTLPGLGHGDAVALRDAIRDYVKREFG